MSARRDRSNRHDGGRRSAPTPRIEEALARAARHGRNALAESVLAARALVDAASLAASGRAADPSADAESASDAQRMLGRLVGGLDDLAAMLRADPGAGVDAAAEADGLRRIIDALLDSLDLEIARWETRGRSDPDARAVLRAFLGVRELLWELGLRPQPEAEETKAGEGTASGARPGAERSDPSSRAPHPKPAHTRATRPRSDAPRPGRRSEGRAGETPKAGERARRRVQRVDVES